MSNDYSRIWPYAIALLTVFLVYRRLRRSFGRQPLRPARMGVRIAILALLACSLVPAVMRSTQFLIGDFAGLLAGVSIGVWGAHKTRFQASDGQLYYVPHTYTGIAVSLLFLGRLAYRLVDLSSADGVNGAGAHAMSAGPPAMMQRPLTVGLLFVVVGYYVCYYSLVLWKSKHIRPEDDLEAGSASTLAAP